MAKTRHQNLPVHRQRVLRADVPAMNRFEGTSSSKKVTQDHEIIGKVCKRADDQHEVSAIFAMRLEDLCERGARILQIEIMGAFLDVRLNLLRSDIRCHGEGRQSFELNKGFTVVKAIGWRVEWGIKKETSDPTIRDHLLKILLDIIVASCRSSHI